MHASGNPEKYLLPDAGIASFMEHCSRRIGETYFRTPRTTITAFINLLAVLEQNPGATWQDLLGGIEVAPDTGGDDDTKVDDNDDAAQLTAFKM